jgi:BMFP domain-containing protein YqiC
MFDPMKPAPPVTTYMGWGISWVLYKPWPRPAANGTNRRDRSFKEAPMQTRNRVLDDIAKVAGGTASVLAGVKEEIEALGRARLERLLGAMNLVTRDEFEAVRAMAVKARAEQERLAERLQALESSRPPKTRR